VADDSAPYRQRDRGWHHRDRAALVEVGGDAAEVDLAAGDLDEEQDVEAIKPGVSTVKKSQASIWAACWRTNSRQLVWPRRRGGGMPWLRRILATCIWEIGKPSLSASP
jgi:hypothetical protein